MWVGPHYPCRFFLTSGAGEQVALVLYPIHKTTLAHTSGAFISGRGYLGLGAPALPYCAYSLFTFLNFCTLLSPAYLEFRSFSRVGLTGDLL